jgi:DNA-directed RNA polymerase specialized sigma24 family protein
MGTEHPLDWGAFYVAHAATACRALWRRFPVALRARFEPLDFVHDAMAAILEMSARVQGDRAGSLLTRVAHCRMLDQYRRPESRRQGCDLGALVDAAPPCELQVEADELFARLIRRTRKERERVLLEEKRRDHSTPEAAALAGMGLRTAERSLARLRRRACP